MGLTLTALLTLLTTPEAAAQRTYTPGLSVGGRAGGTLSQMSFSPRVDQGMTTGFTAGAVVRYAEEKCVGVMGEINIAQRGWKETYDPGMPWSYRRTLTYIDIPVMTHIFFGPKRFKCFINLGPEVAFLVGDKISANFDYHTAALPSSPYPKDRQTDELTLDVSHRIDYGITAGIGVEWRVTPKHSVLIEGRYYYGLGNVFPGSKADTFNASRVTSIELTAGYMFKVK